jgi:hypothetical protein
MYIEPGDRQQQKKKFNSLDFSQPLVLNSNHGHDVIDNENQVSFHLRAVQIVLTDCMDDTLADWHADIITFRKEALREILNFLLADNRSSKNNFMDWIPKNQMPLEYHFILMNDK